MTLEMLYARLGALLEDGMDPKTTLCIFEDGDPTAVLAVCPQDGFFFRDVPDQGLRNARGSYLLLQAVRTPSMNIIAEPQPAEESLAIAS